MHINNIIKLVLCGHTDDYIDLYITKIQDKYSISFYILHFL